MTDAELYHWLDRLLRIAERVGGEDPARLDQVADAIAARFRELAALRVNARDPRRARTLAAAERLNALLDRAERAGYDAREAQATAREQLHLSKSAFYRLLPWARGSHESREVPRLFGRKIPSNETEAK
jgi:hypothetical protein